MMSSTTSFRYPMERVLYNLHYQICTFVLHRTTSRFRLLVEHAVLVLAVCGFGALLLVHVSFVFRAYNTPVISLPVNRAEINTRPNSHHLHRYSLPYSCLSSISEFDSSVDVVHVGVLPYRVAFGDTKSHIYHGYQAWTNSHSAHLLNKDREYAIPFYSEPETQQSCTAVSNRSTTMDSKQSFVRNEQMATRHDTAPLSDVDGLILYSYSQTKGYLLLNDETRRRHRITWQYILISRDNVYCFGEPFVQTLIFHVLGATDTIIVNWFLSSLGPRGYMYNHRTDSIIDLSHYFSFTSPLTQNTAASTSFPCQGTGCYLSWCGKLCNWIVWLTLGSKFLVVIKTCFLYFITTTLVSFTLRETQERMLGFTHQLQTHVRTRQPVVHIVLLHIIENLVFVPVMVGMIFFLIEFYRGDKFISFLVLTVVWLCEVFAIIRYA
jgi:hypothetical protein